MNCLIDTNIVMQLLKGNADVANFLQPHNLFIDTIVYMECIQGQKTNTFKSQVKQFISVFSRIPLSSQIGETAFELIYKFSNSRNLTVPDALIAAACLEMNLDLMTYNHKDFHYIPDIRVIVPPFAQI